MYMYGLTAWSYYNWAATCDFQQCGTLTSIDSDEPVKQACKLRNSKWCSVSSYIILEYESDQQMLWSDCVYAQADLRLCWSHIPHYWKSISCRGTYVNTHVLFISDSRKENTMNMNTNTVLTKKYGQLIRNWGSMESLVTKSSIISPLTCYNVHILHYRFYSKKCGQIFEVRPARLLSLRLHALMFTYYITASTQRNTGRYFKSGQLASSDNV